MLVLTQSQQMVINVEYVDCMFIGKEIIEKKEKYGLYCIMASDQEKVAIAYYETKKEAVDYLCNGSAVYEKEEFEKFFDQYMDEWDVEEEDQEEYKKMIETNKPAFDWGVVEYEGITYFIDYVA